MVPGQGQGEEEEGEEEEEKEEEDETQEVMAGGCYFYAPVSGSHLFVVGFA